jgi:Zn-dependent peptidase ImmA (M78 family)
VASREEILKATYQADRLHKEFDTRARVAAGVGRVDVFAMLVARDIPLMFRPMKKLLGAFIDDPAKGVILTSQRPLPVQRFTAAHELGHGELGHEASADDEDVLTRALFVTEEGYDVREVQANAFASQLLTPSWLIVEHMKRQGWTRRSLTEPSTVYQLSLRMGSSYAATCYALEESKGIDRLTRSQLLSVKPKTIKQSILESYHPANWYGDVWLVTERDKGLVLEGSRTDLIVMRFQEHATSGYVWDFGQLADAGLAIRQDGRASIANREQVGGIVIRTVIAEPNDELGASGRVHLRESRAWQPSTESLTSLELEVELHGPIREGLLPMQRHALLGMA